MISERLRQFILNLFVGVSVMDDGMKVLGGLTIETSGGTITAGGIVVKDEGLTIDADGLTVASDGVYVTGGMTIANT